MGKCTSENIRGISCEGYLIKIVSPPVMMKCIVVCVVSTRIIFGNDSREFSPFHPFSIPFHRPCVRGKLVACLGARKTIVLSAEKLLSRETIMNRPR